MATLLHNFQQKMLEKLKGSKDKKCSSSHSCRRRKFVESNRLLIFKDDHLKGRKVMYDSVALGKDSAAKCHGKSTDTKLIGEMMFGVAPMPQKVSMLKVHTMQNPPQLMVTKVFVPVPSNCESSGEHESFDFYSIQSDEAAIPVPNTAITTSLPVSVPFQLSSSFCDDSGFSASGSSSLSSLGPSPNSSFTALSNSRSRRLQRHQTTTLEYGVENSLHNKGVELVPRAKRPVKIGVGIIFVLEEDNYTENERFLNFFFSHIILIESYVNKLKQSVDEALNKRSRQIIHIALERFFTSVYSLYSAPRIVEPVWLSMMTSSPRRTSLCSRFFRDLMFFVEKYDTKDTNFFLSCLLTGVLTHHLSWTQTVAPVGSGPSKNYLNKSHAKWLNSLGRSHPYNPLWAQLGDLYGAIGFPRRLSRTVVIGKDEQLVRKLLNVLSYFIRCSEILENQESFPTILNSPSPSPSESVRTLSGDIGNIPLTSAGTSGVAKTRSSCSKNQNQNCQVHFSKTAIKVDDEKSDNNVSRVQYDHFSLNQQHSDENLAVPRSLMLVRTDVPDSTWNSIEQNEKLGCSVKCSYDYSLNNLNKTVEHSERPISAFVTEGTTSRENCISSNACRLSDKSPEENVKIELELTVKMEVPASRQSGIRQQIVSKSVLKDRPSSLALTVRTLPTVNRVDSMYDEYDNVNLPDFQEPETKAGYPGSFDEVIMSEPCPDVSHIFVPHFPPTTAPTTISPCNPGSSTGAPTTDAPSFFLLESYGSNGDANADVNFSESHYALSGDHLNDVPDGPSKHLIRSTIELVHEVYADRVSLQSDDGVGDQDDYMRQWASEPAVRPTRLVHRHPSGQSSTGSVSCRPATPSDVTRPHRSSTSSSETTCIDGCDHLVELAMPPCLECGDDGAALPSHDSNFGRSLIADYCESYQSDFVLHGTRDCSFLKTELHQDLQMALQSSVLDEPIDEASCIVADLDNRTVKLYSCKYNLPKEMKSQELISSQLVGRTLESCQEFCKMNVSPEFCLMHLEDQLQSIYVKSEMLVEYISVHRKLYHQELMALHEFNLSDMPLLLAVASTHNPFLLLSLMDASHFRR